MVKLYRPPPAEQVYESYLPGKYIGYTVVDYFTDRFSYLNQDEWMDRILDGRITVNGERVTSQLSSQGARLYCDPHGSS